MAITLIPLTDVTQYLTLVFSAIGVVIISIGGFKVGGRLTYNAIRGRWTTPTSNVSSLRWSS